MQAVGKPMSSHGNIHSLVLMFGMSLMPLVIEHKNKRAAILWISLVELLPLSSWNHGVFVTVCEQKTYAIAQCFWEQSVSRRWEPVKNPWEEDGSHKQNVPWKNRVALCWALCCTASWSQVQGCLRSCTASRGAKTKTLAHLATASVAHLQRLRGFMKIHRSCHRRLHSQKLKLQITQLQPLSIDGTSTVMAFQCNLFKKY